MHVVILPEHESYHVAVSVHNGKCIQLMLPNNIVSLAQAKAVTCRNNLVDRGHEVPDQRINGCTAYSVVAACDNAQELSRYASVVSYGNCGVTGLFLEG